MKKTLLFFLLLFTTIFYAQVTYVTTCADQPFNLTILNKDFIGNLNPAETTVSYFLSLNDAINNTNVIANPTQYSATPGVTNIYGRVNNNGTISTNYFSLTALPPITLTASHTPIICSEETTTLTINASGGTGTYQYSLNGGSYTSNNHFKFLIPGTYNIQVTDGMGVCRVSIDHTITAPPALSATAVTVNQNTTITALGGTAPYEYSLDGISYQSGNVFSNLPVGIQPISVRDAKGCSFFTAIAVGDTDFPLSSGGMTLKNITCWGSGALRAIGYGGEPPYLYSINGGQSFQTSDTFDNLSAGIYPIAIKDSKNTVINNLSIELLPFVPVTATVTTINTSSCTNNGGLTIVANGGQIPHYYSIDGGKTYTANNTFSDLPAGNYNVLVKDSSECISPAITATIKPSASMAVTTAYKNVSCFGNNDGSIETTVIGGMAPYTYSIGNGYITSNTFNNLSAGQYVVTVKDAANCTITTNVVLSQPSTLLLSEVVTNSTTSSSNDGVITVSTTGGISPYSYAITDNIGLPTGPFQASNVFTGLKAGSYGVQVKDANGCIYSKTNIVIANNPNLPVLLATANIAQITCDKPKGTITITATGGSGSYVYSIDNGVNYSASNIFSNLSPGNYTIIVKDSQNTVTTITAAIIPYIPLATSAVITKTIDCFSNAIINVTVSGGKSPYQYSLDNGVTYTSSPIFTNLGPGSYFVRIKDAFNCTVITNSIILEQPVPLTATVTQTQIIDCLANANSNVSVTAAGGTAPYQYSINKLPYTTNNSYPPLYPGTYSFDIKDAKGCVYTVPLIIKSPSSLVATATVNKATECGLKDSVTISATGGQAPYTYSFDIGVTYSNTSTNWANGVQTFFVKDSNGCQTSVHIPVEQSLPINVSTYHSNTTTYNSNDGSITLATTGGTVPYTYSLLNGNNVVIIPSQPSNTFNNLAPGTYGVIVKDAKGCSSLITQVTIAAPSLEILSATATVSQPSCVNPTGVITINATGGTGPYQYSIDNGATYTVSDTFVVTQPGNYIIMVRDSQNAIYTSVIVVRPLDPLFLNAVVVSSASCISNGIITAMTAGGQAPYIYSLNGSTFQNTNIFTNLSPGVYTIEAKDSNGCIANTTVMLTEPEPVFATVTANNQTIIVTAVGGTGNYQYSLDGIIFQSGNIFTVVNYGTYNVFVRDQNGCMVVVATTLNPPSPLIDDKDEITIEFKPGQTLGDLVIQGQNIKWYSNQNPLSGKTTKLTEVMLPLSTVLINGTTYYASQTINGIESIDRLAVTAKLSGSLSTPDVVMPDFRFYPNPVQHTLTIDNSAVIDEIEIIAVSGKSVLARKINNTHSEIDLSNVASGVYFLKIKSEGKVKIIKVVKK